MMSATAARRGSRGTGELEERERERRGCYELEERR